jgi:hypothetical protein
LCVSKFSVYFELTPRTLAPLPLCPCLQRAPALAPASLEEAAQACAQEAVVCDATWFLEQLYGNDAGDSDGADSSGEGAGSDAASAATSDSESEADMLSFFAEHGSTSEAADLNSCPHRTEFFVEGQAVPEMAAINTRVRGMPVTEAQVAAVPQTQHRKRSRSQKKAVGKVHYVRSSDQRFYPLTFPLLFPRGQVEGWHKDLRACRPAAQGTKPKKLSRQKWARQVVMRRKHLHAMGPLLNEFLLDVASNIEDDRLRWIKKNQKTVQRGARNLPADSKRVVVPPSFRGGFADRRRLFRDAMGIVRRKGTQDWFITMTCNSNWPEIQRHLLPGQTYSDRPDICARVFYLKLKKLIKELPRIFNGGKRLVYMMAVVEFQHRKCRALL